MHARMLWSRFIATAAFVAAAWLPASAAAQDIVVGQIGPFTVLPAPDAKQVNEGIKAYFAQVNAKGGVNGRRTGRITIILRRATVTAP